MVPVRADIHNARIPSRGHSGINDNSIEAREAQCAWRASLHGDSAGLPPWFHAKY